MRKAFLAGLMVAMAMPLTMFAAKKLQGTSTFKDVQPANNPNPTKKHKEKQTYDLSFDARGNSYTCRTPPNKSMNATDFVVGSSMNYEIDGQKAKLKTSTGKQVECSIVRVAVAGSPAPASSLPPS